MAGSTTCPKCNGRMELGTIIDMGYGSVSMARWHPGEAKKAWHGSIKLDKKALRDVETYRCQKCGFLESYAK